MGKVIWVQFQISNFSHRAVVRINNNYRVLSTESGAGESSESVG